jgi:putative aldouronate transport system substrate-binding protein
MRRKQIFAFLTMLTMAFATSCGAGATGTDGETASVPADRAEASAVEDTADTPEDGFGDLVTLDVFSMVANTSGLQANSYWTDILARDVGVEINLLVSGAERDQRLAMMMAAGSLPDVMVFYTYIQVADAIAANLLLPLDDRQDALQDAFTNFPTAIQYIRDHVSNNTGNVYVLPSRVQSEPIVYGSIDYGPYLRWDLYQAIGAPSLYTWEDLLPTLREMQDINPENEHGQPVYAISWWTDWDDSHMQSADDFAAYYGHRLRSFATINLETLEVTSIFEPDSLYRRWLHFMFTANQMGMLDPDTMTQRWDDYLDKGTAGRTLFSFWSWGFGGFSTPERAEESIGFMPVFIEDTRMNRGTEAEYVGNTWVYGIGADTNNTEAALRFVNYMYSAEGNWDLRFGEQGVFWDLDENGPFITEFGFQMQADPDLEFSNGGRPTHGVSVINSSGFADNMINPLYNASMNSSTWQRKDFAPPHTNLVLDWEAATGINFLNMIPDLRARGLIMEGPFAPMAPISEADDATRRRVGDFVQVQSWLTVFANDEAEFDSLWNEMVDRAYGMGAQAVVDAFAQSFADGVRNGAAYMSR